MSDGSSIEWTDATWNPVTGCTRVSPGCAHCYIERTPPFRVAGRRFENIAGASTTGIVLHPSRLDQPVVRWTRPRRVFVCSLADLFHEDVPFEFIHDVLDNVSRAGQHTFQVLTKRPERALKFFETLPLGDSGPDGLGFFSRLTIRTRELGLAGAIPNMWLGVSIENARYTWRADVLRQIPAAVRFVSAEPLLGSLFDDTVGRLVRKVGAEHDGRGGLRRVAGVERARSALDLEGIDWLIAGGESGPGFRPVDVEWVRELRDACRVAGTAFFFKQWGGRRPKDGGRVLDGRLHDEFPAGRG